MTTTRLTLTLTLATTLVLAACGQPGDDADAGLALDDGWVRAEAGGDMTAAFGTLVNDGDTDLTVIGGSSDVAGTVELHEVVMTDGEMVMRPKDGGFVIPAGGQHVLEPGGDHVMLMDLNGPVEPGEEVSVTLNLSNGDSIGWTLQARDFDGAEEDYDPAGTVPSGEASPGGEATHDMSSM